MTRVIFYTENAWAFGNIHQTLCQLLRPLGVDAVLLDWHQQHSTDTFQLLMQCQHVFVTMPPAVSVLHQRYGVPLHRIVSVAHGQWDLRLAHQQQGSEFYQQLAGHAVVSENLRACSAELGIAVAPAVLTLGVDFHRFARPSAQQLRTVGYAGAQAVKNFQGTEIKRGYLVQQLMQQLPALQLLQHQHYAWPAMPAYYAQLDALLVSSSEEGAGLPAMEAAAAGRAVLSTSVGYVAQWPAESGVIQLPMAAAQYQQAAVQQLQHWQQDPAVFARHCAQLQQFAQDQLDWSHHVQRWAEFLISCASGISI